MDGPPEMSTIADTRKDSEVLLGKSELVQQGSVRNAEGTSGCYLILRIQLRYQEQHE